MLQRQLDCFSCAPLSCHVVNTMVLNDCSFTFWLHRNISLFMWSFVKSFCPVAQRSRPNCTAACTRDVHLISVPKMMLNNGAHAGWGWGILPCVRWGMFGLFPPLAIMNNGTIHISVWVFCSHVSISLGQILSRNAETYVTLFNHLRNCQDHSVKLLCIF